MTCSGKARLLQFSQSHSSSTSRNEFCAPQTSQTVRISSVISLPPARRDGREGRPRGLVSHVWSVPATGSVVNAEASIELCGKRLPLVGTLSDDAIASGQTGQCV